MAVKRKSFLHRKVDPTTESIALGSAFSVLFVVFLKSMILAIPLGLALALAHRYGLMAKRKKR